MILAEIRAAQNPANIPLVEGDHTEQVPVVPVVPVGKQGEEENIVIAEAGSGVTLESSLGLPIITTGKTRDGSGVPDDTIRIDNGSPSGSRTSGTTSVSAVFQWKKRCLLVDLKELHSLHNGKQIP